MKWKTNVESVKFVILITTVALAISCPTLLSAEVSDQVKVHDCLVLITSRLLKAVHLGCGFVIGDGSLIVTAHHVVFEESAKSEHKIAGLVNVASPYLGDVTDAEIVASNADLDLVVLKVSWRGHPAVTLADMSQILSAEYVDIIGIPEIIRSIGSNLPVSKSLGVQSETLPVDFVAVRQQVPRFITLLGTGQLGDGWSGAPIVLENSSVVAGCFTALKTSTRAKHGKQIISAIGPAIVQVHELLKGNREETSIIPSPINLSRHEDSVDVFLLVVQVYRHMSHNQYQRAFDIAQELVRLRPDNSVGYLLAGSSIAALGRYDQAEKFYKEALSKKSDGTLLKFIYAQFLTGQGRSDEALELYEQIWRSGRSRSAIALNLCNIYLEKSEFSRGIEILKKALKNAPENAYLWHLLGSFQTQSGQLSEGIISLTKAVELLPEMGPIRGVLAHTLEKAGELDEAEKHFRELLAIEPDNSVVHMWLAKFLAKHRPSATEEALKEAQITLDLPVKRGLSRKMIEQFIKGLQSKSKKEALGAGKINAGMDETIVKEKVSSFIGCDLPASAQDVKSFSRTFARGSYFFLTRFDIPLSDLRILLAKSDKLPDFPELHKNPKIQKDMVGTLKTLKIDWWKPDELANPICAGWQKRRRAMGDPRVWIYNLLKICCSQEDNNLIRVYIDFFSEADDMVFTNPDMKREIEEPKVWSQKLAGDVFAAIIANDNNSLKALNIDLELLSELGGYRREYDFSGLNRMVHYQKADSCFVIVSPVRHQEGKYSDQEIRFGFKLKQGIWEAGSIEKGNIGDRDDFLKKEGFEEFSRTDLARILQTGRQ